MVLRLLRSENEWKIQDRETRSYSGRLDAHFLFMTHSFFMNKWLHAPTRLADKRSGGMGRKSGLWFRD
jgi:hypothetical protein